MRQRFNIFVMVGPIKKIPMHANLYYHTGSYIKISGCSGVRFPVSGFCTSVGCFKILFIQKNFFCASNIFLLDHSSEKDLQACFAMILCLVDTSSSNSAFFFTISSMKWFLNDLFKYKIINAVFEFKWFHFSGKINDLDRSIISEKINLSRPIS